MKRAPLQLAAVRAVTSDPSAMALLSPPSRVLLAGIEGALVANALDSLTAESMSEAAGDNVAGTVADVISEVPMVGQAIGFLVKAISALASAISGDKSDAEYCNRFLGAFKVHPTGSMLGGGATVPSDLFASVHHIPKDDYWKESTPEGNLLVSGITKYPSALGMALRTITTGIPADIALASDSALSPDGKEVKGKVAVKAMLHKALAAAIHGDKMSARRRAQFESLIDAIAASHGPELKHGAKSDGGLALWPVFLDLLLAEKMSRAHVVATLAKRGKAYLPNGGQGTGLHHDPRFEDGVFGGQSTYKPQGDPDRGCTSILADQIENLLGGWKTTVHPYYSTGKEKLSEMQAKARQIGQRHASGHHKAPVAEIADDSS